jgi:hypothetical protein
MQKSASSFMSHGSMSAMATWICCYLLADSADLEIRSSVTQEILQQSPFSTAC